MKLASKLIACGAIGALIIAGLVVVLTMENGKGSAVGAETPVVAIQSFGSDVAEEAILVTMNVSGKSVPMNGVHVTICKMNVTTDGEQLSFRVMETITLQTGADGKAQYNFSEGSKYMVCVENQERRGFACINLNEAEANLCYAHEWNWDNMNGQTFTHSGQGQGAVDGQGQAVIQTMGGDLEQDRRRSQDLSCC